MAEGANARILVVDDSFVMRKMVRKLLADSEFEVVAEAKTGKEAIALHRKFAPDLVLLDIVMPDMDGILALEAIRAANPAAKVVMSSSLGTREKVMETLRKGAASFLMKPYEREILLQTLRTALKPPPVPALRQKAPPKFFGQFLLERGRITREQLLSAVEAQTGVNVKLGTLAIDRGYLTAEQVTKLNMLQRQVDKRLGEIAVEHGMLSQEQVVELLAQQKSDRLLLGEALVQKGHIALETLDWELRAFRKEQECVPESVEELYRKRPNSEVLTFSADVFIKMFLRIADETVKPALIHTTADRARLFDFTISQGFRGDFKGECCLNLTSDMMLRIASRMLEEHVSEVNDDARDGAAEFVNIVNGNVCAKLSALGRTVDLDPPKVHDNRNGRSFDLFGAAADAELTLTPMLHPQSGIELCLIDRTG